MPARRLIASVVVLVLLSAGCIPKPAGLEQVAQEQAQAQARSVKLANEAFERGTKLYDAGDWEKAVREFEIAQAYDRSDPRYPEMILKTREQRGAIPPGSVRLVYKFAEGESWTYRTSTTLSGEVVARDGDKVGAPTSVSARYSATLAERVLRLKPDGGAEVETRISEQEASVASDLLELPWPASTLVASFEISRQGAARLSQVKGGNIGLPTLSGLPSDRPVFAGRPLKAGDEWTESEGQTFRGSGARQERYTFLGLDPSRGEQVARLTCTTQESFIESFGPRGDLRGKVKVDWNVLFDAERGRVLEAVGQGKVEYGWRGAERQDWQATLDLVTTTTLGE